MVKCVENISRIIWDDGKLEKSHKTFWASVKDIKISDIFWKIQTLNGRTIYPVLLLQLRILKSLSLYIYDDDDDKDNNKDDDDDVHHDDNDDDDNDDDDNIAAAAADDDDDTDDETVQTVT